MDRRPRRLEPRLGGAGGARSRDAFPPTGLDRGVVAGVRRGSPPDPGAARGERWRGARADPPATERRRLVVAHQLALPRVGVPGRFSRSRGGAPRVGGVAAPATDRARLPRRTAGGSRRVGGAVPRLPGDPAPPATVAVR